jgi:hypothetical protein
MCDNVNNIREKCTRNTLKNNKERGRGKREESRVRGRGVRGRRGQRRGGRHGPQEGEGGEEGDKGGRGGMGPPRGRRRGGGGGETREEEKGGEGGEWGREKIKQRLLYNNCYKQLKKSIK